jgi:outer membrane lipoprotein-sorting protein
MATAALTTNDGAGASERPNLPPKTAAQLLAAVEQAHPASLTGTIVETAHLGLPSLPGSDSAAQGTSLQSLLTGSHTMRIWYDGPTRQRIALLAPLSERDLVHNGTDLWTYTSTTNEVTHQTVERKVPPTAGSSRLGLTPQQAAQAALKAIDPSTRVRVDLTSRVAGRAAYQIDLLPRDARSLVTSVRIAIDASTSVPLRVQVFGSGGVPALEVGFTDISYSAPSPSVFRFVPPSGATVNPGHSSSRSGSANHAETATTTPTMGSPAGSDTGPVQLGKGWTTVVKYPAGLSSDALHSDLMQQMSIAVPQGQLIKTALLSILVTDNGDVYVGSVSGADLQRVAATGHGL